MKIDVLVPSLSGGGAELVVKRWADGLTELGHEVSILLTHGSAVTEVSSSETVFLGLAGKGFLFQAARVRRVLGNRRADVVLSAMPFCNILAILGSVGLRTRVMISEHAIHTGLISLPRSQRIQWWLAKVLYRYADHCITPSHALAAELAAVCRVRRERLWVVPNPVVSARADDPGVAGYSAVSPEGSGEDQIIRLACPGRMVESKRLVMALQTAQLLTSKYRVRTEVHFLGDGPEEDRLRSYAAELSVPVTFHGWVEKWWEHVPERSVVLITSQLEGLGNVLIEAAAVGYMSVVSSKALGVADACIPGITATLTSGDSVEDYAQGVLEARRRTPAKLDDWLVRFTLGSVSAQLNAVINSGQR